MSDEQLEKEVRLQLSQWFRDSDTWVDSWRHLRTYRIPYAQPGQVRTEQKMPHDLVLTYSACCANQ